ncbi:MAG: hypothetical protein RIC85_00375 [Gammaproteobacteria bacterium]|nr:hypothetical protein [Magnetovibrio sp.]MBO6521063.1 hypothetical protein [Rhodospirillales bacterium]MDW3206129.1 hypothetical protein [Alphaproteobacteria bacterium]HCS70023.1 hypothetical protein [Rhodospirillaceae bacterium]|tara:strand:+ start:289 stop:618 length:330 start_codon:yes stop_codon:yes gene_type:complete
MSDGSTAEDDALREQIRGRLSGGLETEVWPRAETSEMVNELVGRLKTEAADDLDAKLVVSGFTDHTIEADGLEQPCETCMYYLVHRRFCELPELMLPVEPEWSCRLWRI